MTKFDIETAIRSGDYEGVQQHFRGFINEEFTNDGLNLLELLFCDSSNESSRLRIAQLLIDEGININHQTRDKSSALHFLLGSAKANWTADPEYLLSGVKLLIQAGADVNLRDVHGGTPLSYAIAVLKSKTEELIPIYKELLEAGAFVDDRSGTPSCIEMTKMFPWRADLLTLLEEYDD